VLKNVTITLPEDAVRWARKKAIDENTSLSGLLARMLEQDMKRSGEYWRAFETWRTQESITGIDAAKRLTREEAHARRR